MLHDKHREDSHSGELYTGHGSVRFAEDFDGEYFYFDVYDSALNENKRIMLSVSEMYAIAKAGVLVEGFDVESLITDVEDIGDAMKKRESDLEKIRSVYNNSMPSDLVPGYDAAHYMSRNAVPLDASEGDGGDGTPHYAVEGWGIVNLHNGDFEVSYRV